jgi:predicted anti-sigma-YlaC factor YlaD
MDEMMDSHLDSDRLPAVAHGLARWSAEEEAHLAACAECRTEWNLVRIARTLGRVSAERIVPARVAASVARRLAAAPIASPVSLSRSARWVLGVAAAAAITVAVLVPRGNTPSATVSPGAEIAVLHELDGLSPAELEAVLETIPPGANEASHVEVAPIEALTAHDLELVLRSME